MANTTLYENFERVKQYIGQEIGLATNDLVSYSYLEDKHYLSESDLSTYATKSYVVDYVNTYAPEPDLSAYVTKIELNEAGYISSIPSDYATYQAISEMSYATQTYVTNAIADIPAVDLSAYATKAYVSSSVASLIDGAPEGLNTLDKLAYAINDDPDFAYNISVLIDEKADTAYVYTKSEINELNTYTQGRINNLSATVGIIEVNFVSKLSLDQAGYATKTYVADYVATYGMPDLSSYATKTYVADYVNTYAAQPDLSAYVTKVELSNASYATTSQIPVIDENLVPKSFNKYTLGSNNNRYKSAYIVSYMYLGQSGNEGRIWFNGNNGHNEFMINKNISPSNQYVELGTPSSKYLSTYSYNYYLGDEGEIRTVFPTYAYVVDYVAQHGGSEVTYAYLSQNYPTYTYVNETYPTYTYVADYVNTHSGGVTIDENIIPKENNTYTLGSSGYEYVSTYTYNLILGGTDIKTLINNMFSYDSATGTLTITTLS